jgi:hypothetical protein
MAGFILRELVIMNIFYTSYKARLSTIWRKFVASIGIGFTYMNKIRGIMLLKLIFIPFKAYLKTSLCSNDRASLISK